MIDYTVVLFHKYPNAKWILDGDNYEGLNWLDDSPKPSKSTLDSLWQTIKDEEQAKETANVQAKASAIVKLAALGLTPDEIASLG